MGAGCNSISPQGSFARTVERALLKPLAPPCDAINVEVYFVDRDVNDPVTKTSLWSQLNQLGAVDAEIQHRLDRDGFRFGIAPSNPPYSLQSLLHLTSTDSPRYRTVRQQYVRPSGSDIELTTAQYPQELVLELDGATREFNNARCVLRMKVERLQERWARLEFLPEIHSGEIQMRASATENDWQITHGQEIESLFKHRFAMELNVGDFAVIGSRPNSPSVAQQFFAGDPAANVQRLCVVRLNDTVQIQPERSNQQLSTKAFG